MMKRLIYLLLITLVLPCCSPEAEQAIDKEQAQKSKEAPVGQALRVHITQAPLQDQPRLQAKVLTNLPKGTIVYWQGDVSDQYSKLEIEGREVEQPWLLVKTDKGQEGWVFAGAFEQGLPLELQMEALLGRSLAPLATAFRKAIDGKARVPELCRQAQQLATELSLQEQGRNAAQSSQLARMLPELRPTWLEAEQRQQWFVDYRAFLAKAQQSPSRADDALLQLYFMAYPVDSIGYICGDWQIEAAPGQVYSLLGRGRHLAFLQALEERSTYRDEIGPELDGLRGRLLNDILEKGVLYWETQQAATAEVQQILQAEPPLLTPGEQGRIRERLLQLQADSLAPNFNYRAGKLSPLNE